MTPFNTVPMQIARNPIARAIANNNLASSVRTFQTRLYLLDDGEDCEGDAVAAMQVLAVVSTALDQTGETETPDARVIRGGMSCLAQIAQRGFLWRTGDAGAIDAALTRSVAEYKRLPAVTINHAWRVVMATNARMSTKVNA